MTKRDSVIDVMAKAMARQEGFYLDLNKMGEEEVKRRGIHYVKNGDGRLFTVNQAYNNPGNIMGKWGNNQVSKSGFVIFPTLEAGWRALKHQISLNLARKLSFYEFFAGERDEKGNVKPGGYYGYAPAKHGNNNPQIYAQNVVNAINNELGLDWTIDTRAEELLK